MDKKTTFLARITIFSFSLVFSAALFLNVRAAGEVDTSFKASAYASDSVNVRVTFVQPDGKILIGGAFTTVNGVPFEGIVRLNNDGTLDPQFNPPPFYDYQFDRNGGPVSSVALQPNGKIIVAGQFTIAGSVYKNIARLNADGSLDTTFADLSAAFPNTNNFIRGVTVTADDTIYINGQFTFNNGNGLVTYGIAKLNSDGSVNYSATFPPTGGSIDRIAVQPDGKIVAATNNLTRFMPNGSYDGAFPGASSNGSISKIIIQSDGKILIVGDFNTINGFAQGGIARLNADGSLDTVFNANGTGVNNSISDLAGGADGKIYVAGSFTTYNGVAKKFVAKLNADGSLDNSYTLDSALVALNVGFYTVSVQSDGKAIISAGVVGRDVYRTTANGTIDSSFNRATFGRGGLVSDIIQQADGKILVAGFISAANGVPRNAIARYNLNGTLDTGFNPAVLSFATDSKLAVQSDGKIIIIGTRSSSSFVRLNSDGSLDNTFHGSAQLTGDVKILSDGKIFAGGVRLNSDGSLDTTYNAPRFSDGDVFTNEVLPNGKYLIGGSFTQVNSVARGRIARLNNDGTLDLSFNPPFGANQNIYDVEAQADGKIIVVGDFTGLNGTSRSYIGRLNVDGSLDTSFNPVVDNRLNSVKIQPDGKILIGGFITTVNGVSRNKYARLNSDGTLDNTFDSSGNGTPIERISKIALQSDGNILLAGYFARIRNVPAANIARLLNNRTPRALFDYDGDGRADLSVFRPSSGTWYIARPTGNPAQNFDAVPFGAAGDKLVPADYDGDGRTDLAVFRSGVWYLNRSSQGYTGIQFGTSEDIPAPADFDGDGKADLAVFRPSNGTWYVLGSTAGFYGVQFGANGDKPVVADYDGDGKADLAVYRAGVWYIQRSSLGFTGISFGTAEDKTVPADFDGDGKADLAVFRPSNGTWYLNLSTAGFTGIQFGQNGDLPAPADYDGDGKADVAVFRAGIWYLNRTSAGFTGVSFGSGGDLPTPNSFVR